MLEDNTTTLDELIAFIQNEMSTMTPTHEDYIARLDQLERLYKLKAQDKPERVSRDTLAVIGGNLLGILIIVGHERMHAITSKAFSLINRPK